MSNERLHSFDIFLDPQLIPYRCCCCSSSSCWGGATLFKKPKAPSFQIGSGWNLARLFFRQPKYASIDAIGIPLRRQTFKMAAVHAVRPPLAVASSIASAGCPLVRRAHVTSLARCMRYSSWSIVHSYLLHLLVLAPHNMTHLVVLS